MSTNIGLSKTKNSDDILVPVVRFVPISEIEDEIVNSMKMTL